ncbi:MAG: SLC13 family permease, partial [Candidatus Hydrogenedentes bacterium]|nr:SLC13 family permease [Candidatus Hydrogenedentota bacterium]
MTTAAILTVLVVALVFAALIANYSADMVLLAGALVLCLGGVITPGEAFAGFANDGMLTVAALFVCAAALRETGALDSLGRLVLGRATTERGALARLSGSVTLISAFLNNTPVVAMFIPVITSWCSKHAISPSRLLMPLSFLTILGGTCTLIGTSTNLVVTGMMDNAAKSLTPEQIAAHPALADQLKRVGLFEVSYLGVPYAIIGCAYLLFIGYKLLPERKDFMQQMSQTAREYLVDLRVAKGCSLIGRSVEDAGLRRLRALFLIEIQRGEQTISPVSPDQLLEEGDVLTFTGEINTIVDLERIQGLVPVADEGYEAESFKRRGRSLCEAVVSSTSPVLGKTIRDSGFRALYNAAVVAVHRGGERLRGRVGDIELCAGDTLLLQAGPHFLNAQRYSPDFFLVSGIEDSRPVRHDKAWVSLGLLVVLIGLMASNVVPIVMAAFLVAGLMVATRCISIADARQSIEWQTLIAIAASFGIGKAL